MADTNLTLEQRFWAYVGMPDDAGCRRYLGARTPKGYGVFAVAHRISVRAHRLAWELANGRRLAKGELVLHSCDVPSCCNPEHLFVGTPQDNMADRDRKRRQARGERQGSAKLNAEKIVAIRARMALGDSLSTLGREFGVDWKTLDAIRRRKTWAHVQ